MSKKVNVLVFPCGAENASEIHQALRYSVHVRLFGASSVEDHGRFRFVDYAGGLPHIQDPGFDEAFGALIRQLSIDLVFATHDTVASYLAERAPSMGFHLVNGHPRATAIARRKSTTYAHFADCQWAPHVYSRVSEVPAWPIVVKPDCGQGGQGVGVARDADTAMSLMACISEPLLVEHLPGVEITVDCFTDRRGRLVWVGPRTRERVRAGITMRSRLLDAEQDINAIAGTINERLPMRGPWFFQLKATASGAWKLLEISCRVAGAMVAQRARGINLPLMAVLDYLGHDLSALPNPGVSLIDRSIATRASLDFEYDAVSIDLDDTLIIDGHATPIVMAFLYQAVEAGKRLVLITRHAGDIFHTLSQAKIDPALFDEVVHLVGGQSKAEYVSPTSIFIDNHFPERLDVAKKRGVPVFDVDGLEFLVR